MKKNKFHAVMGLLLAASLLVFASCEGGDAGDNNDYYIEKDFIVEACWGNTFDGTMRLAYSTYSEENEYEERADMDLVNGCASIEILDDYDDSTWLCDIWVDCTYTLDGSTEEIWGAQDYPPIKIKVDGEERPIPEFFWEEGIGGGYRVELIVGCLEE